MTQITITIDGPASSGKRTTAEGVARKLGYRYLDTGALYRGVSLFFDQRHIPPDQHGIILSMLGEISMEFDSDGRLILNGEEVETQIRSIAISERVSTGEARNQDVRDFVTKQSQAIIAEGGYVLDGRDAATHIAPHAELKIYLDCAVAIRAERRALEFGEATPTQIADIQHLLTIRDNADSEVLEASRQASNALVDTSNLTITEQIEQAYNLALEKIS